MNDETFELKDGLNITKDDIIYKNGNKEISYKEEYRSACNTLAIQYGLRFDDVYQYLVNTIENGDLEIDTYKMLKELRR